MRFAFEENYVDILKLQIKFKYHKNKSKINKWHKRNIEYINHKAHSNLEHVLSLYHNHENDRAKLTHRKNL